MPRRRSACGAHAGPPAASRLQKAVLGLRVLPLLQHARALVVRRLQLVLGGLVALDGAVQCVVEPLQPVLGLAGLLPERLERRLRRLPLLAREMRGRRGLAQLVGGRLPLLADLLQRVGEDPCARGQVPDRVPQAGERLPQLRVEVQEARLRDLLPALEVLGVVVRLAEDPHGLAQPRGLALLHEPLGLGLAHLLLALVRVQPALDALEVLLHVGRADLHGAEDAWDDLLHRADLADGRQLHPGLKQLEGRQRRLLAVA
mmetsp:Transcript_68626/g.212774  ORF Transcript_68626/g.212774 Transcript_68626/m.212774 type:complete len:259 (+) Transcript_68626:24-800(+)